MKCGSSGKLLTLFPSSDRIFNDDKAQISSGISDNSQSVKDNCSKQRVTREISNEFCCKDSLVRGSCLDPKKQVHEGISLKRDERFTISRLSAIEKSGNSVNGPKRRLSSISTVIGWDGLHHQAPEELSFQEAFL
ncbi:hypothetical protein K1719_017660 [Acacia pycnantha]|nr:hypothetical protein K1719_017660 [Acacia pycnantha]